jgi:hypothetical protein
VVTTARYPDDRAEDHPYRRFAERHAFRLGSLDVNRRLPLPVPAPMLSRLAERARAAYLPAYRIETFTRVPDDLAAPLCACMNRVESDAPSGENDWEEETMTPDRLRGFAELDERVGRLRMTSVARLAGSGEVVGYTELFITAGTTKALQSGTLASIVAIGSDWPSRSPISLLCRSIGPMRSRSSPATTPRTSGWWQSTRSWVSSLWS